MWVVAIVVVIAFWGAYRFAGFVEISIFETQNPFLNRLGNGSGNGSTSCFVGFRCFGNTSCSFHVPFILHAYSLHFTFISSILLSCSFHLYSVPFIFLSYFFPFHSNVHSCLFIFLSFACIFLSFCIHVLLFPSKVMKMALWLGQGTECNKWFSLSYR